MKEVYCKMCGHLLFKIDTETYGTELSGNKPYIKFHGMAKPLIKHIEVSTTCDKCKNEELNIF